MIPTKEQVEFNNKAVKIIFVVCLCLLYTLHVVLTGSFKIT